VKGWNLPTYLQNANYNSRTSNRQCILFSKKNPIIRVFCLSGWLVVPINQDKCSYTVQVLRCQLSLEFVSSVEPHPISGIWRIIVAVYRHTHTHTQTGRTPLDEWSARRRGHSLQNHTTNTIDEKSCSQRNSKWRFQRSSGRRPTPYTAPLPELF